MQVRNNFCLIILFFISGMVSAQVNANLSLGFDFYSYYRNPEKEGQDIGQSSGAILSPNFAAQIVFGKNNFSFGLEPQVTFSPWALDINQYKGIGAVAFPLLAKFNFGSFSGFSQKIYGFSIGAGVQYNRTELFGLNHKYADVKREFFRTNVLELCLGGGIGGINFAYNFRIGFGADKALSLNTGFVIRADLTKKNQFKLNMNSDKS